jgi:hypothetical protein
MKRLPPLLVVLVVLGSTAPLNAQTLLDTVFSRIRPGQTIRVSTRDQGRVEYRFGSRDFAVTSIDSLWVRGRSTATGAIVGGLTLGAVSWAIVSGACSPGADCSGVEVPAAAAVGLVGGALLGALIGSTMPRWKLRYARKGPAVGLQWNPQGPAALTLTYRF